MAAQNRDSLKVYFETGKRPTQQQFADLIDSAINQVDDEITIDAGNVGIGTNSPAANLHVSSGTSGDAILLLEADTDDAVDNDNPMIRLRQGAGIRGINIGFNDVGFGLNNFGIGRRWGATDYWNTFVIDIENGNIGMAGALAVGSNTGASGSFSVAMGVGSQATALSAVALGTQTQASGLNASTAMGFYTEASGNSATAMGIGTRAESQGVTALGRYNTGGGDADTWIDDDPLFEVGNGSNVVSRSNALTVFKSGRVFIANSLAIGVDQDPNPDVISQASGEASFAAGIGTFAASYGSTALGHYNTGGGNPDSWVDTDPLFEIGNGTDDLTRSNALTVLKNGSVHISDSLIIGGGSTTGPGLVVGDGTAGFESLAVGEDANATGHASIAVGIGSNALAECAVAMGEANEASGYSSVAMGFENVASGYNSTAMGNNTLAESYASTALGRYNTGGGDPNSWIDTDPLFEIGNGTSDVVRSNALTVLKNGRVIIANSLIVGNGSATGLNAVAMGSYTLASGNSSTAMGWETVASGNYSTTMGGFTEALGSISTAMGFETVASGDYSTAMGEGSVASGDNSTAMGRNTQAESYASTALGRYNTGGGDPNSWIGTDPLFEIGNGTGNAARSNALTVLKNGNVGINTTNPTTTLSVNGAANKTGGGDWGVFSDKRLKKQIKSFKDGLTLLKKVKPVSYRYNGKADINDTNENIGIIAQEIREVFPYMVTSYKARLNKSDKNETDLLSFDGSALKFVIINAIKELDERLAKLES